MRRSGCSLCLLLGVLMSLSACERPFVEEEAPAIEVVTDLSTALSSSQLDLQVSTRSLRTVDSLSVNGLPMSFDASAGLWTASIRMRFGLNVLRMVAADARGLVAIDTAYALYFPVTYSPAAPPLPAARGGHTATLLLNGSTLVLGGTPGTGGDALDTGFILRPLSSGFAPLQSRMTAARTGHTASLLPDGRLLIVGGSRYDRVDEIADLVDAVEIYDPRTGAFQTVPYDGPPIRRAFHTAVVRDTPAGLFVDLYGGRGDVRYGSDPRVGDRRDLAILQFRNDSLVARSPAGGLLLDHTGFLWGHTETPLDTPVPGVPQRYLVAGVDGQEGEAFTFRIDYVTGTGIVTTPLPSMRVPRTRHAAILHRPGYVLFFGGTAGGSPASRPEVYVEDADRFFFLPQPSGGLVERFGLTATKLSSDRILLTGGFSPSGNGIATSEVLVAASF